MYQVHMSTGIRRSGFTNGSRRREKGFSQKTYTDGYRSHQMCRTRDRTAFRVRGRNHKLFAPQECADGSKSRTSPSTLKHNTVCLALHQVRGGQVSYNSHYADWTKQRILHSSKCSDKNSHCSECADRDLFLAEFTKR